ncbi:MAG TPA: hypothetical protein VMF67_09665 [Rhizomicrobium sp.]|nr:hypothetical protein [Rhizomicrobium sp.]
MVSKKVLVAAAGGLVVLPWMAFADDEMQFSGTAGGGDTYYDAPNNHIGDWNANGSVLFTIDNPGFDLQGNFDNDYLSASAHGGDFWSFGGDAFWRDYAGAIGLNFNTHAISDSIQNGSRTDLDNFGAFGQWYAAPVATLEFKAGWLSQHYEGPYAGVAAVAYPLDSLAVTLDADYAKANHLQPELKDIGLSGEWMPLTEIPVSIAIGYSRAEIDRLPVPPDPDSNRSIDIWTVSLKVYLGNGGAENTLRDYQRNGPVNYDAAPSGLIEFGY